jgi:FKBP-type peptidyl-prolyl cis-trans isomerase FklB
VAGTTAAGKAFLEAKAKEAGVVATGTGLLYKVVKAAPEGAKKPKAATPCSCHVRARPPAPPRPRAFINARWQYRGTLVDGTEFDSSYKRGQPATFAPNQVIRGWTEAMQLMGEGAKWELYIPSELAYGDSQRGAHITPGAVLVFELEILKVNSRDEH